MFATTPIATTVSATPFPSTCRATSIESSTLVPPSTTTTGRGAPAKTRESCETSRSIRSPAAERSSIGRPTTVGCERWAVPNASLTKKSPSAARRLHQDGLRRVLGLQRQVLLGVEADVLEHQHVAGGHAGHRVPGAGAEDVLDVGDGLPEHRAELPGVRRERRVVLLPGPRLVGQDHDLRVLERPDRGQVLAEALVVQDRARPRVDRRVEVQPEQDRPALAGEGGDGADLHAVHLRPGSAP